MEGLGEREVERAGRIVRGNGEQERFGMEEKGRDESIEWLRLKKLFERQKIRRKVLLFCAVSKTETARGSGSMQC